MIPIEIINAFSRVRADTTEDATLDEDTVEHMLFAFADAIALEYARGDVMASYDKIMNELGE